jgi:ABC-type bacteriocin/lantibiotic exporter with double-glycine peptidase domain
MEVFADWISSHPTETTIMLIFFLLSPFEKLVMPIILSNIVNSVRDSTVSSQADVLRNVLGYVIAYCLLNVGHFVHGKYRHSAALDMNDSIVKDIFQRTLKAEWSLVNNSMLELVTLINGAPVHTWKLIHITSSLLAGQLFTVLGLVYMFWVHATPLVTGALVAILLVVVAVLTDSMKACSAKIRNASDSKMLTYSVVTDVLSSKTMLGEADTSSSIESSIRSLRKDVQTAFDCRQDVRAKISTFGILVTVVLYAMLFHSLVTGEVTKDSFITLLLVSSQVFELPIQLDQDFADLVEINVFKDQVAAKTRRATPYHINRSGDSITVDNVRIAHIPDSPTLSFSVPRGNMTSLTGPNGCGKSSLLRILAGLEAPLHPESAVISVPADLIYVPQSASLMNKSILENISIGLRPIEEDAVFALLADAGLNAYRGVFAKFMRTPIGEGGSKLSGGQRQIVWIIRCIHSGTTCMLLDEPTSWMSKSVADKYLTLLKRRNITAIIVSHDDKVHALADRRIVWEDLTKGSAG